METDSHFENFDLFCKFVKNYQYRYQIKNWIRAYQVVQKPIFAVLILPESFYERMAEFFLEIFFWSSWSNSKSWFSSQKKYL